MSRILVIEDHTLVREALTATLEQIGGQMEVSQAGDAESALAFLKDHEDVALVLLDLMLPGMSGFGFLTVLRKRHPALPVIVISALEDGATKTRAARLGAAAFVTKSSSSSEVLRAVLAVLENSSALGVTQVARQSAQRGPEPGRAQDRSMAGRFGLSAAQARVVDLLLAGKSNREIADFLGLSEGTVKIHLSAIYKSLNVTSWAQALVVAARQGVHF
jgi:DNA-binding NarL/FixJ family response regulator